MFENAKASYRDRKASYHFDGPVVPSSEHDGVEEWHERIKVTCTHDSKRKAYEAHVSWCKAAQRDGYAMEQSAIFTDPYLKIASAPAARFSENKFSAFCTNVQEMCVAVVADELNVSAAAELLRKAKSYDLVKI